MWNVQRYFGWLLNVIIGVVIFFAFISLNKDIKTFKEILDVQKNIHNDINNLDKSLRALYVWDNRKIFDEFCQKEKVFEEITDDQRRILTILIPGLKMANDGYEFAKEHENKILKACDKAKLIRENQ